MTDPRSTNEIIAALERCAGPTELAAAKRLRELAAECDRRLEALRFSDES